MVLYLLQMLYISIIIIVLLDVSFLVMPKVLPRVEQSEATARVEIWPIRASYAEVRSSVTSTYSATNTAVPPPFGFLRKVRNWTESLKGQIDAGQVS